MNRCFLPFFLIALAVVSTSCKKEARPEGLPELYPFSIKLVQGGAPLEGANVTLQSDDPALMRWPCGGNTDAEGIAKLNTFGFDGAPAGKFKVLVFKSETEGGAQNSEEAAQMMRDRAADTSQRFDLVDPKYKLDRTTPLSLEVVAGPDNPTPEFDLGEAVREEIKMK